MGLLIAVSGVFLLLTLYFLAWAVRGLRQRRLLRAAGSTVSGLLAAAVLAAALVLAVSYWSFSRLTDEQNIASIEFRRVSPQEFQARVMVPERRDRFFTLRGDEWQIDARLVTWKPPATVLGLDPIYQLERLSGRFAEIDRERSEARTVHALSPDLPVDVWTLAHRFPLLTPGVDAYYGSATYMPMTDGARFDVSLSRDALIARPANDIARDAVGKWD